MIAKNPASNLLEQSQYKYSLQDVEKPNLYREIYPYDEIPKVAFNHRRVPLNMPHEIWITDTTFRDGQQSVEPYSVKQIVDLFNRDPLTGEYLMNYGLKFTNQRDFQTTMRIFKNAKSLGSNSLRLQRGSAPAARILTWSRTSASVKRAFSFPAVTTTFLRK